MSNHALLFRLAWHEIRHGWRHFRLFLICLVLGVTVITTVNLLGNAITQSLLSEAQSLLGGDVEISVNGNEATKEQLALIERYGALSHVATLRGMLQWQDLPTLVEIKAVDEPYPLLGTLLLNKGATLKDAITADGVAVDGSLLDQLGVKVGDQVRLGTKTYTIRAVIDREPDKAVHLFSFGPRVMLSHRSLKDSGLVTPFSLIKHQYRVVLNNKQQLSELTELLKKQFPKTLWQFQTGTDGNQTIKRFIEQLIAFLTLAGFATFLIGGIGIGSAVRAYMEKKAQTIAMLKTLGGERRRVLWIYLLAVGGLGLAGCLTGIALATTATALLLPAIAAWLPVVETASVVQPSALLLSCWYGLLIVYLFSLPALFSALETKPALLFRSRGGIMPTVRTGLLWKIETVLAGLLVATLVITASDRLFILGALAMTTLTCGLFALCTKAVMSGARKATVQKPWLRLALSNLYRPGATTGTVVFAIGISLTVLISLTLTEANFQTRIQRIVEEQAPSLFMMDIQPEQRDGLAALLQKYKLVIYPMVRGRITALNGKEVQPDEVAEDVRWAIRGDRGLSYSQALPANAQIAEGEWWPEDYQGKPLVSVDSRFLEGMKLKLGDTITLNVLGQDIAATISSARKIDYTTFQINFAMMFSPGAIDQFPHSYLATVYLDHNPAQETQIVKEVSREFPGVTIIRTREAVELVKEVMDAISQALRIAVITSLVTGLLVLASAMSAMLEQRLYDTAILKVLGAKRRDIFRIYTTEWMLLGLITALMASGIATLCSWLIMLRFRGEGFYLLPHVTLTTAFGCLALIWLVSYLGNRSVFAMRPAGMLRNE